MLLKAYPRVWVDLTAMEAFSALFQTLNPFLARGQRLVPRFESQYAEFIGTEEAVSFTNCRSALYYSLKALDLKEGDEVILPAFTFWTDAAVVLLAGLKPVFVDVEFDTFNIDAFRIEDAITPRTRVIMPAHLNGLPADMDGIMAVARAHKIRVIEDCARTCGGLYKDKRVGSFDIGAFSFGYGKSFYGFGGGMVTSDDRAFIARLRNLKKDFNTISIKNMYQAILKGCILKFVDTTSLYGFTLFPMAYNFQVNGDERFASWFRIKKPEWAVAPDAFRINMYDIQARSGFRQIKTIDITNERRRNNMRILNRELVGIKGLALPTELRDREHISVHYAVWSESKKELQKFLMDNGIDAQDESAEDVTQMARFGVYARGDYPNARRLNGNIIYLPTHPCLGEKEMLYIAGKVRQFFRAHEKK